MAHPKRTASKKSVKKKAVKRAPGKKTTKAAKKASHRWENLVVGLTGPVGSGCSTMAGALTKFGFAKSYRISELIRQELKIGSPQPGGTREKNWRKKLQDHGNTRRKKKTHYWAEAIYTQIKKDKSKLAQSHIVIDGIRSPHEVKWFRETFPNFFLVAICADMDLRWDRVKKNYGGRESEFERDDKRDKDENVPWGQAVQLCVNQADYVFFNNEDLFTNVRDQENKPDDRQISRIFKSQIEDFLPLMLGEENQRSPTSDEIQMAAAYAFSNSSNCLKRHVGAVITVGREGRELAVSTGYNDNPPGTNHCIDDGGCFKDEKMQSWFSVQGDLYCPGCGKIMKSPEMGDRCANCGDALREWLWPSRAMEICTAIHAEERAISSLGGRPVDGGALYVTTFPCFQCARLIIDKKIARVVYVEAYPQKEAKAFLQDNRCEVKPFIGFTARAFFKVFRSVN